MTEVKAFKIFIIIYSVYKCVRLNANIELTLHGELSNGELKVCRIAIALYEKK
jgi:hypothetical protein